MSVVSVPFWQRVIQGGLALWLGLLMPLLCIPNITSNHKHGIHWAWQVLDDNTEQDHTSHTHAHSTKEPRSSADETALQLSLETNIARAVANGSSVLRHNDTPHAEQVITILGSWGTLPAHPIPLASAWLLLMVVSVGLLRLPSHLALPWNPPKLQA